MKLKIGEVMFNFITGFGRVEYNTIATSPGVKETYPYMMRGPDCKIYLTRDGKAEPDDKYPCVLTVEQAALIGYFTEGDLNEQR